MGREGQRQVRGHPRTSSSFPPLGGSLPRPISARGRARGPRLLGDWRNGVWAPGRREQWCLGWQQSLSWGALRSGVIRAFRALEASGMA